MSRSTKLLTFSTAALAPWLLTSAVAAPDTRQFYANGSGYDWQSRRRGRKALDLVRHQLRRPGDRSVRPRRPHQQRGRFGRYPRQHIPGILRPVGMFTGATGNNDTSGPDGVLIRDSREIWVGDGNSTVKVFDVAGCGETTTPKKTISTGAASDKRADEMCYDPDDQLILVANNAADPPFASLISTIFYAVVQKIRSTQSTNGIEQCLWSPRTGLFYITVPGIETPDNGHGQVVVINPASSGGEDDLRPSSGEVRHAAGNGDRSEPRHPDWLQRKVAQRPNRRSSLTSEMAISSLRSPTSRAPTRCGSIPATTTTSWRARTRGPRRAPRCPTGRQSLGIIDAGTRVADTGINGFGTVNGVAPPGHLLAHPIPVRTRVRIRLLPTPLPARRSCRFQEA